MSDREGIRAAVFGTGRLGKEIIRRCALTPRVDLVAGIVITKAKDGVDLGELAGLGTSGVTATIDIDSVLNRDDVEVVFHCGLGTPAEVAGVMGQVADAGKDGITAAAFVHPRLALGDAAAQELHERAVRGGARLVGTGWNPGLLLDVLPIIWASGCVRIERVYALRVAEMREWGAGVHDECGIGLPPDQVPDTISNPLHECVAVIADALALPLERIDNFHEPYVSSIRREYGGRVIEPGFNAGFHKKSTGICNGRPAIEIEQMGVFCIDPSVDPRECARIKIEGDSTIEAESTGGNWYGDSYPVTAARAINAAGPLRTLPPGLYRPDQLPLSG
jgi:hypothetical protein